MKKSTFKKFVAFALVVMMLATTCIINTAFASNLTITVAEDSTTEVYGTITDTSLLTDGVKSGAYTSDSINRMGTYGFTNFALSFATAETFDTIKIYGYTNGDTGSFAHPTTADKYVVTIDGAAANVEFELDATDATYPVTTLKLASAVTTSSAVVTVYNQKYLLGVFEIEVENNSGASADETSEVADETSEVVDETSEVVDETSEVADETSEVADETSEVADETSEVADETSEVADETSEVADETSEVADETSEVADETSEVADETSEVADETSEAADETSEVADETSEVADETSEVADETSEEATEDTILEEPAGPVEVNFAAGKKYELGGAFLAGKADDGKMLTDGVIPEAEIGGQTVAFSGTGAVNTITIDLAKKSTFNKIVVGGVVIAGNRQYGAVVIEASNDGTNYTAIAGAETSEVVGGVTNYTYALSSDVAARYVRISITSADYVLTVGEVQVIGTEAASDDNTADDNTADDNTADDNTSVPAPVEPGKPGDAGFAVVALVAMISLAAAVVVSKRRFN